MRQPKIGLFGQFRPAGVDNTETQTLQRMAGLTGSLGGIAAKFGVEKAQKEGKLEGLQSVQSEGGKTKPIELREDSFSIRNKSFNEGAILAHRAAIQTDSKNTLDALQREESQDPDMFALRAGAYAEGLKSDMPEELAVLVGSDLESSINSRSSQLKDKFFARIKDENQATINEGLETFKDDILNATRQGDLARVEALTIELEAFTNQAIESENLTNTQKVALQEALKERAAEQAHLGEIERTIFNDDLTLEEKVSKGEALLKDLHDKDLKDLDPAQKDSLMNVIGAKVSRLQAQLLKQQSELTIDEVRRNSNLKVSAKNGLDPAEALMEETELLFSSGKISGNERTSIINDILSGNQKSKKKHVDFAMVAKKLQGQNPEIVLDQKQVDQYYDEKVAPTMEGMEPTERLAHQAEYIANLRAVPNQIEKEITNNILSNDPELIRQSAELIDRIDEIPGLVDLAVTPQQRAFVSVVNGLSASMHPEEAIQIALKATDPTNSARVEAKKQELKQKSWGRKSIQESYPEKVAGEFSDWKGADYLMAGLNKEDVEAEYASTFEPLFLAGMSAKDAHKKTAQLLRQNWKESQFGFMRNPPEDYYQVAGEVDYIKKQLISEIRSGTRGMEPKEDNVYLFSDDTTMREAARGAPSYRMFILDESGLQPVIMSDKDGFQSNRWMPDVDKEKQRQIKENEKKALKSRGRDKFETSNSFLKSLGIIE